MWPLYALSALCLGFLWVSQSGNDTQAGDTLFSPTPEEFLTVSGAAGPDHGNAVSDAVAASGYGRQSAIAASDITPNPKGWSRAEWAALQNSILSNATFSPVATPDTQSFFESTSLGQLIHDIISPPVTTPTTPADVYTPAYNAPAPASDPAPYWNIGSFLAWQDQVNAPPAVTQPAAPPQQTIYPEWELLLGY